MTRNPRKSRYFQGPTPESSDRTINAVKTFGPFSHSLGEHFPLDGPNNHSSAATCFMQCPTFRSLYLGSSNKVLSFENLSEADSFDKSKFKQNPMSNSKNASGMYQEKTKNRVEDDEYLLHKSVRHLCPYKCYFKAYLACRDWHALREKFWNGYFPEDYILKGWSCRLVLDTNCAKKKKNSNMTVFVAPNEEKFQNIPQVLRRLGMPNREKRNFNSGMIAAKVCQAAGEIYKQSERSIDNEKRTRKDSQRSTPTRRQKKFSQLCFVNKQKDDHSPFGFLEELFMKEPWRLLISVILLNKTQRNNVDPVLHSLLTRCPDANSAASTEISEILPIVLELGLGETRAKAIVLFSKQYIDLISLKRKKIKDERNEEEKHYSPYFPRPKNTKVFDDRSPDLLLSREEVKSLYGCGAYAADAYMIFVRKSYNTVESNDYALNMYVGYINRV